MATHFHGYHLLLQQSGKDSLGNALVFHQIFEHRIIQWVCYVYNHNPIYLYNSLDCKDTLNISDPDKSMQRFTKD